MTFAETTDYNLKSSYLIQNDPILTPLNLEIEARVVVKKKKPKQETPTVVPLIILRLPIKEKDAHSFEVHSLFQESQLNLHQMSAEDIFFSLDTFVAGWANMGITPLLKEALEIPEIGDMILSPKIRNKIEKALVELIPDEIHKFFENLIIPSKGN